MRLHPAITYTLARFALVLVVGLVLYLLGFRAWVLAFGAVAISLPLSWFVLRRQREAFAKRLVAHRQARKSEKQRLRAALRGDDELGRAEEPALVTPAESSKAHGEHSTVD